MSGQSDPIFKTRTKGKLLLTGEYAVLDGALALAMPVRYGQSLRVDAGAQRGQLHWTALEMDGTPWFRATFRLPNLEIEHTSAHTVAELLQKILRHCQIQKAGFLSAAEGLDVLTQTDFPRAWGLGTSSTLIAALARWGEIDPYDLLFNTLGGSGYDIACADATEPIIYQLKNGRPVIESAHFRPSFADQLYFVYLGKKQDSRAGIQRYREKVEQDKGLIDAVSALTERAQVAASLPEFEAVLREHEQLLSRTLELPRAKDLYFHDFWGEVKSLGAWGGDFVLATSDRTEQETRDFFNEKGFGVFMGWREMSCQGVDKVDEG